MLHLFKTLLGGLTYMKNDLLKRFISYVKIDTQSDEHSDACPSTAKQWVLLKQLKQELIDIGMSEVTLDDNGYLFATLKGNTTANVPTVGFLAHVDTATDFTGENVQPQVITDYDGGNIVLNKQKRIVMETSHYPQLKNYLGHTLITTDGTTLLGADNKAGVAEIITAMDYLIKHPDVIHGDIRVAFTPDEEIGRGPHKFDVSAFHADFAYTIDGGPIGELQYESFNAAYAKIRFQGNNVHPGTAKNKMIHATKMAMAFHDRLPKAEAAEFTEGYEGFFHLLSMTGDVETAELYYIIRDHDTVLFEQRKERLMHMVSDFKQKYGDHAINIDMGDQYYNMKNKIAEKIAIVDVAKEAMAALNIQPIIEPIRGGTDGSQLSYMGLPTPNIFTGGENFHGKFEFASLNDMTKAVQTICKIAETVVTYRQSGKL